MKTSSVIRFFTCVGALILAGFVSVQASELKSPVPREKFGTSVSAEDLESYALVDLKPIYFIGRITCSAQAKASLSTRAKEWPVHSIIEVRGYADNAGSAGENLLLSGMRAEAVARLLTGMGIPPERIRILALGAIDPDGPAGDPKHQRVDVRVFVEPPAATVPSDASAYRPQD
ncbi:MAG TPA: OmpA family protein [Bryobacteraceae bacterium]|nr:OmpA family protein [Bryobacteraceae bacterium]